MAFPLLCWIVLSFFLGCLGLLGLAVTRTVSPDGQGHSRGFLGGCGAALALFFLCGLGVAGLAGSVTAIAIGTAVDKNPIRRIEIRRSDEPGRETAQSRGEHRSADHGAVQAIFTVRGGTGEGIMNLLGGLVEIDPSELDDVLTIHHRTATDGSPFDVYEFRLPISEHDLERFERDVEHELDGLKLHLPESVAIEFAGVEELR